jgi:hypothetical protein
MDTSLFDSHVYPIKLNLLEREREREGDGDLKVEKGILFQKIQCIKYNNLMKL